MVHVVEMQEMRLEALEERFFPAFCRIQGLEELLKAVPSHLVTRIRRFRDHVTMRFASKNTGKRERPGWGLCNKKGGRWQSFCSTTRSSRATSPRAPGGLQVHRA